jgi:hypothetical protein
MQVLEFGDGHSARLARPHRLADVAAALPELGLRAGRPVLAVVGGAAGLDEAGKERLRPLFSQALLPVAAAWDAVVVDGGTDSGVMQLLGQARDAAGASFPLVGVAAAAMVILPGDGTEPGQRAPLERHHSHFVLVPGSAWGDESPWLARVATEIAAGAPSATVLVNGGDIAFRDAAHSVAEGRPVLVIQGTGRTADKIAAALDGDRTDPRAAELAASPRVKAVSLTEDPDVVRAALRELADLDPRPRPA